MIGVIFRRELLDLLLSWRLAVVASLMIILGTIVVVSRSATHHQALKDYSTAEAMHTQVLDSGISLHQTGGMLFSPPRRPASMSAVAEGTQQSLMERMLVSIYEDPITVLYPSADLLAVMGIVVSLGALLLSSDLICGEREAGTVRLITANAVKRSSILLGKWLASLVTLGTGLLLLFAVVAILQITIQPDVWSAGDWASFAALFLFSLVYASAFLLIGLFISTSVRYSGTAAILALLVWTVSVFVLPCLPAYVAREVVRADSPTYTMIQSLRAETERQHALEGLRAPLRARGLSDAEIEAQMDSTAVRRIWDTFWEKRRDTNRAQERSLIQGAVTAVVEQVSPFAAYTIGGTELTGVGVASMASFLGFTKVHSAAMDQYLKAKWKEEAKKNPGLKKSAVLDTSDRPRAAPYAGDPFVYRLAGALIPLLSLGLFNILFFALAWRRFLRYDIR